MTLREIPGAGKQISYAYENDNMSWSHDLEPHSEVETIESRHESMHEGDKKYDQVAETEGQENSEDAQSCGCFFDCWNSFLQTLQNIFKKPEN